MLLLELAVMTRSTANTALDSDPVRTTKQLSRLMLAERMDAANAAFQVGYEIPSQFSREYNRLFGAPPLRDIASLRKMAAIE